MLSTDSAHTLIGGRHAIGTNGPVASFYLAVILWSPDWVPDDLDLVMVTVFDRVFLKLRAIVYPDS